MYHTKMTAMTINSGLNWLLYSWNRYRNIVITGAHVVDQPKRKNGRNQYFDSEVQFGNDYYA